MQDGMKRFFQFAGLIFAAFALAMAAGAMMPGTEVVESVATVDADVEDVSDYLSDLGNWPDWLGHVPDGAEPAFGDRVGDGASFVWQDEAGLGAVELLQVTDDLIRAALMTDGEDALLTVALGQEAGATTVLIRQERALGGFPFLSRLESRMRQGSQERRLETSLQRLSAQLSF